MQYRILSFLREKDTVISESAVKACYLSSIAVDCCIGYSLDNAHVTEFIPDLTYTIQLTLSKMVNNHSKTEKALQQNLCGNISWMVKHKRSIIGNVYITHFRAKLK